jgi:hypothetical protein
MLPSMLQLPSATKGWMHVIIHEHISHQIYIGLLLSYNIYIYKFGNNDGYITFCSTFPNNRAGVMLAGGFGNLSAISIFFRSLAAKLSF